MVQASDFCLKTGQRPLVKIWIFLDFGNLLYFIYIAQHPISNHFIKLICSSLAYLQLNTQCNQAHHIIQLELHRKQIVQIERLNSMLSQRTHLNSGHILNNGHTSFRVNKNLFFCNRRCNSFCVCLKSKVVRLKMKIC